MAYNPFDEEEEDPAAAQTGTGAPTSGVQTPTTAPPQTGLNPSNSNRFVNFASYFNANNAGAMGDGLVNQLDSAASSAKTGASNARTDIANQAQANTISGPGSEYSTPRAGTQLTQQAQSQAAQTYKGPTTDGVYSTFDPYMRAATKAQKNISTAQDPSGVQAVRGGNMFDATLASAGAGGRKAELQKKYGSLMGDAEADRKAAWDTANAAQEASTKALGQWKDAAAKFGAEDERVAQRNKTFAEEQTLIGDVDAYLAEKTKHLANEQVRSDYKRANEKKLQQEIDTRYGAGTWDRYKAAKDKQKQASATYLRYGAM